MLLDRAIGDARRDASGVPVLARIQCHAQFLAVEGTKRCSAKAPAPCPRTLQAGFSAITDFLALHLRQRGMTASTISRTSSLSVLSIGSV
jgi:hypothetical protein